MIGLYISKSTARAVRNAAKTAVVESFPHWSLGGGTFNVIAGQLSQRFRMPFETARNAVVAAACAFTGADDEQEALAYAYSSAQEIERAEALEQAAETAYLQRAERAAAFYG